MDYYPLAVKRFGSPCVLRGEGKIRKYNGTSKFYGGSTDMEGSRNLEPEKKKIDRRPGYIGYAGTTDPWSCSKLSQSIKQALLTPSLTWRCISLKSPQEPGPFALQFMHGCDLHSKACKVRDLFAQ
jgi:hypothetical protein